MSVSYNHKKYELLAEKIEKGLLNCSVIFRSELINKKKELEIIRQWLLEKDRRI